MGFDAPLSHIPISAIVVGTPEESWLLTTTMQAQMLGHQFIHDNERVHAIIQDCQRHREYLWNVVIRLPA